MNRNKGIFVTCLFVFAISLVLFLSYLSENNVDDIIDECSNRGGVYLRSEEVCVDLHVIEMEKS